MSMEARDSCFWQFWWRRDREGGAKSRRVIRVLDDDYRMRASIGSAE